MRLNYYGHQSVVVLLSFERCNIVLGLPIVHSKRSFSSVTYFYYHVLLLTEKSGEYDSVL